MISKCVIIGNEKSCTDSCTKDSLCPIGFWKMYEEDTCFQDSASSKIVDTVQTFSEAEEKCAEQGARLFRFRSKEAFRYLKDTRLMDSNDHIHHQAKTVLAVGMKFINNELYYSDNTPVDPAFVEALTWKTGYPIEDDNTVGKYYYCK